MSADSAMESPSMNPDANQSLDRTPECAIVVSWPDLTHGAETGLIRDTASLPPAHWNT